MAGILRDVVGKLDDSVLLACFADGERWDRDGALPSEAVLCEVLDSTGLCLRDADGRYETWCVPALQLQSLIAEVWRELAVRSNGSAAKIVHVVETEGVKR